MVSIGMPAFQSAPKTQLVKPAMLATERSISPVMMIRVFGRARSRTGMMSMSRNPTLRDVAKPLTVRDATMMLATRATMMAASQLRRKPKRGARRVSSAGGAVSTSM